VNLAGGSSFYGINYSAPSAGILSNNTIRNINTLSNSTGTTTNCALTGILYSGSSPLGVSINQNIINGLYDVNTGSANTTVMGIYVSTAISPEIKINKIYDLKNSSTGNTLLSPQMAVGVALNTNASTVNLHNNQISLGAGATDNTQFIGVWQQASGAFIVNLRYNSIVISGTVTSGSLPSYAYMRGNNSTTEITSTTSLVNNILANSRSGGSGKHYAIANMVASPGTITGTGWLSSASMYNLLASNSNTVGLWGATDYNINTWRAASGSDLLSYYVSTGGGTPAGFEQSINLNNLFTDITTGNLRILHTNPESWYLNGKGIAGASSSFVSSAYFYNAIFVGGEQIPYRSTLLGYPTDIGAHEFSTNTIPPSAIATGSIGSSQLQTLYFGGREIGRINWVNTTGSFPSAVDVKYYTGANPSNINTNYTYLNSYYNMTATGGSAYNYNLTLTYDDAMLGNMANETSLNIVKQTGSNPWNPLASNSTVDAVNNRIANTSNISEFGVFAGSNQCAQVPVFTGNDVVCASSVQTYSIPSGAGRTYTWTANGGTINSGQGTASISITWGAGGIGSVIVQDSLINGNCSIKDTLDILINPSPTPAISGLAAICENNSTTYSTPNNLGRTYTWTISGGTIASGAGTNSINAAWGNAGSGTLIVTDSINATGCKTTTSSYSVVLNAYPVPVISGSTIVCENTSSTYATGSNSGRTYVWTVTGGTIGSGQGTNSISVNWGSNGAGTVVVSDSVNATGCKTITVAYNVTKNPVISTNTVSSAQTICNSTAPLGLTGSTPVGGNGTYTYIWESSTTSASSGFATASGTNNTINYAPAALTATTWYRRVVSAGVCSANTSAAIQITVDPVIATNTISGGQTICSGATAAVLTGSAPTGGNGTYTYAWESSTTSASSGFAAASGIIAQGY
jgi:hypothetical protein